ncbi:ABC transporter ATP-binding protein [Chitinilyticum litopenaei]|uniref:ABC transporter ATP-binding protein n=1 Tax=Chitinilyticum litopenaei TaxID=1121276 RepID=UPI000422548D|nr:ABC transporter ATP-binding protein [Chitinilyticum litopenaei]
MSAALELEELVFAWPGHAPVLDIARFRLEAGERVFLHGASGSGKSTLLALLTGIASPQAGSIRLLERPFSTLAASARDQFRADHIGYVFQQFNLLPYLDLLDNVLLPCRFSARRRQQAGDVRRTAQALLAELDLADPALHRRPVNTLSVGQQQRVALARALIGAPELLIADEPTSALDGERRQAFIDLLLRLAARHGSSVVFVSHDATLAAHFDRTVALADLNAARPEADHA